MTVDHAIIFIPAVLALIFSMAAIVWLTMLHLRLQKVFDLFENEPRIQRYRPAPARGTE